MVWEAIVMMDRRNWEVRPERYKTPIQVEINIAKSQFELAVSALRTLPPDDEHLVGLKRKVYLRWARSERNAALRKRIAADGLAVPIDEEVGLLLKEEEAVETSYWEEEPFDT